MMRLLLIISLFFVHTVAQAKPRIKPDSAHLQKAMTELYNAMIKKDSVAMGKLVHKKISYGHSNGWVENKKEMIANLYNGKLTYTKIERSGEQVEIVRETATVRGTMDIDAVLDGKAMSFKLHVLQVWVWKDKEGWKLLGRQSLTMKA
ncbi:MAG TPA: nuclear transport factor 2 family protein [Flavipsychrobacter sp.]|nr:nuclear transport factor 2 family protein [Flavipsychrobacter sp.]